MPSESLEIEHREVDVESRRHEFNRIVDIVFDSLRQSESLSAEYSGEQSHFVRFNNGRIRQSGVVDDATIRLRLYHENRNATLTIPVSGDASSDIERALLGLAELRQMLPELLDDPHQTVPRNHGESHESSHPNLLDAKDVMDAMLARVEGHGFGGIYTAGPVFCGNRNSAGQDHWFGSSSFVLDYSILHASGRAVKRTVAGERWQPDQFLAEVESAIRQSETLGASPHRLSPGRYRSYLAPAATAELLTMMSWDGVSEASIRQGASGLAGLRSGKELSHKFTLKEDFAQHAVPRFNEEGEVAPVELKIIDHGRLHETLVNARTAEEYNIPGNAANRSESLRAPCVEPGEIPTIEVLKTLDRGVFISNLHYLNWSDRINARVTGMTRYACFLVENGEITAPIEDLRFDDTLFGILGDRLLGLTREVERVPLVETYGNRSLGGYHVPGLLVDDFTFTL